MCSHSKNTLKEFQKSRLQGDLCLIQQKKDILHFYINIRTHYIISYKEYLKGFYWPLLSKQMTTVNLSNSNL